MKRFLLLLLLLLAFAPAAFAYNIVLKNGSILFAREKYTVKANNAIITLQNGTVVSYPLDQIDVAATEKYNKENAGNVIALETGGDKASAPVPQATAVPSTTLQDIIRKRKMTLGAAPPKKDPADGGASAFQTVEPAIEQTFRRILDGASITQYRLATYRGKVRLLATANTEEAVFNTLAATARALSDLANHGKEMNVEIVLTTSAGDSGGTFEMSPDHARQIVNGNINTADYFLRNVIL
jgi:hypothetical protein